MLLELKNNLMALIEKIFNIKKLFKYTLFIIFLFLILGFKKDSSFERKKTINIQGESLVLASTISGKLCFNSISRNSVIVRSTFLPNDSTCKVYTDGIDYIVDYQNGEIKRTIHSSIPDYSKNPLYGKKNFDHKQYSNYSNHPYFIWIDYTTKNGQQLKIPNDQSKYLMNFRKKLDEGIPVTIVSYGNSITAGGEASSPDLRFQYRWANYLKRIFPKADLKIEDVSIPGYTSKQGIEWWDNYIGKTSPDLVIVGWGMNDHNILSVGGNTPEQFKKNLMILVSMIKERKKAEVILYSSCPPNDDWHYGSHSMENYAKATKEAALESNCAYVDVYNTWKLVLKRKDHSSLLGNNINHPNDFGHWLYEQSFEAITF